MFLLILPDVHDQPVRQQLDAEELQLDGKPVDGELLSAYSTIS